MQFSQEGRQTWKDKGIQDPAWRFHCHTRQGDIVHWVWDFFWKKMNVWSFLVKLCFRQHFCTSGRRHLTLWQLFMRASRAVSFMSCPHLRSENTLPLSDIVKVDLNLEKRTITYSLLISCRPCKTPRTSWLRKRGRTKLKQIQMIEGNLRPQMISELNKKKSHPNIYS